MQNQSNHWCVKLFAYMQCKRPVKQHCSKVRFYKLNKRSAEKFCNYHQCMWIKPREFYHTDRHVSSLQPNNHSLLSLVVHACKSTYYQRVLSYIKSLFYTTICGHKKKLTWREQLVQEKGDTTLPANTLTFSAI